MWQLLSTAAVALQLLAFDAMDSACRVWAKLYHDTLKDSPGVVRQEPLLAPILVSHPVDGKQAMETLKTAPQMVKVVTQPPPKQYFTRLSSALASARPSAASQQPSSQPAPSKGKGKPSSSVTRPYSGQSRPFQGLHTQKRESSSFRKLFCCHVSHKDTGKH